ncbi:coenzyme F420-0:L-glutamate ligase/coenzyme F420-1:gamma-L-glutamate ligase [Kineococcus radiotolerans]|uniref:F420-dependent oxidoreductase, putative n=2 Tax=Kineococcus radiotolerans TaxID=131568 RepID=A6WES6_KINRD|nr:coenzyme F420-0:L-glutamate ligase [Kineococcus radiotolerans]ABS05315.1 F420-dependent oxidoreductase, putative [Kineococcus radiotolerans SRS30216 = ATCC BAA-149]MBB2902192.1 coenzyme F420-0:L-glutamate ligase/coenzyme F420-1:gamma-L-glutamate ligase [Kineococcus radiotolerans]
MSGSLSSSLQVVGIPGIGEVVAGDDVAGLLVDALHAQRTSLGEGDVVAVSSKVLSKAAGLTAPASEREEVVLRESRRLVAARRTPHGTARVVEAAAGPVMAAAGVDASNVVGDVVLLLPHDADAAARALRDRLRELTGATVGVVVTDTAGRPWRAGQTDFALGSAGLDVLDDLRGRTDTSGRTLTVTARAVVDEIAAAADLVKGKTSGVPAALIRGLGELVLDASVDAPGARSLVRTAAGDWFRLGHVEAVRAALGAGSVEPPPIEPGTLEERLGRAAEVACAAGPGAGASVAVEDDGTGPALRLSAEDDFTLGVLTQRVLAAVWTESLVGLVDRDPGDGGVLVRVVELPR